MSATPEHGSPARAWVERSLVGFLCACVGWFYAWTLDSTGFPGFTGEQRDYYNLLIDGYLEGQLHMKVEVPEALRALKNPYDPAQRPQGLGLHDASFYQGKYYTYFGAAPMLTLMLPFRVITGTDLPLPLAVTLFVYGGFLASVGVWLAVRRRYFPETSLAVLGFGIVVLGFANGGLIMLRRPDMWELPIAGGGCFAMLMLGCVWRSLHTERKRAAWFAAAGVCLGLAIASRPTYLIASPCLAAPLLWWWRSERGVPWRLALHAAAPLAVIGALMAWHNVARFGDPLQFGQAYQFSLDYESKLSHFGARYVPFNLRAHFLAGAEWSSSFPYIRPANLGPAPAGFTAHRGDVHGILANFPITWLVFLTPLALWRRTREERGALGAWLATAGVLFALAAAVMLSFFSALGRYQGDFLPAFVLLAGVGLLVLERALQQAVRNPWRGAVRLAWMIAAAASVIFGVLYSWQFDRVLIEQNPVLERDLARRLNPIPAWFEPLFGVRYGAVEFALQMPKERRPGRETLFTVGERWVVDRVFVQTLEDGRVRLGCVLSGSPEQLSPPLVLEPERAYRVRVTLGSLYPRAAHPFFNDIPPAEARRLRREARLELDGAPVLRAWHRPPEPSSGKLRIGKDATADAAYPVFRGRIDAVRRERRSNASGDEKPDPFVAEGLQGAGDTLRLRVRFPSGRSGQRDPLVVTGRTGAGDILMVEYVDERTVRFAIDHWGLPMRASAPVRIDFNQPHDVVVTLPSLAVVDDALLVREGRQGRLRVSLDGAVPWEEEMDFHPSEAEEVTVGRNLIGGTRCGPVFGGEVLSAVRVGRE